MLGAQRSAHTSFSDLLVHDCGNLPLFIFCLDCAISQAEYTALANKLGDYVVRLLDKVHGNAELDAVLNAGDDSDDPCRPHGELARLQLAVDFKEKKV